MRRLSLTCSLSPAAPLDRVLEHSVTYALIEINDPAATASGLQAPARARKRAALIALDQMDRHALAGRARSSRCSTQPIRVLKDTAWWVAGHHPEWGDALAGFFATHLHRRPAAQRDELQQKLVQFGDNAAIQALHCRHGDSRVRGRRTAGRARSVMATVARTRLKTLPPSWVAPLETALRYERQRCHRARAVVDRAVHSLPKDCAITSPSSLLRVARDSARPIDIRLDALAAAQDPQVALQSDVFDLLSPASEPDRAVDSAPRPRRFSRSRRSIARN